MKRISFAFVAAVASAPGFALGGCGQCGHSEVGSGPSQVEIYQSSTDSAAAFPELKLLDLTATRNQWTERAKEVWKPIAVRVECQHLVAVPMITRTTIEPLVGGASTVQCVATGAERAPGRPVVARAVEVDGQLASATVVYSITEKDQRLSAFRSAVGNPERLTIEDRVDPLPTSVEAYLRLDDGHVSALLVGQVTVEQVHQDLRALSTLHASRGPSAASIEGLGIGAFQATDPLDLSTIDQR